MSAQKDRLLAAAELLNMTPDDLMTALDRPIFPETLVGIARERQARILDRPRVDPEDARTLARCFRELDIHLAAGGDLPAEWQPRPEPPSDDPYCAEHGRRFDPSAGCPECADDEPWPADSPEGRDVAAMRARDDASTDHAGCIISSRGASHTAGCPSSFPFGSAWNQS